MAGPRLLEASPCVLKGLAGSVGLLSGIAAWVKSARPSPLRRVGGDAGLLAVMTDPDVAVVDEPALPVGILVGASRK